MIRSGFRLAALCLACFGSVAWATHDPFQRGFDLVPVKPTAAMESGIAMEGADLSGAKSFRFALLFDLNVGVLALKLGNEKLNDLVSFRTDAHLIGSYTLHKRIELGAVLPLTVYQRGDFQQLRDLGLVDERDVAAAGLGDFRLLPRFAILDPQDFPVGLAAITEVRLPTGDGGSFLGDVGVMFAPRLAIERAFGPVRVLGNVGYRLRTHHAQYINLYLGNEFAMAGGAIIGLPDFKRFTHNKLLAEMHLTTPVEAPFTFSQADSLKTPWELLVGVRTKIYKSWGAELAVARGLGTQTGYGRETFRTLFGVRYDFDFQDRDGDGIADHEDACPDDPEDKDGFQDSDGCPDPDNDEDGIPDAQDGCPTSPGSKDYDGCPDRDNDQIPDNVDKCPDEPGPAENEGCPAQEEVVLESDRIRVSGAILFETAEATIQPQSYKLLDEVYKVLSDNPDVGPVLIEGHTDNRGSRPYNMDLSARRAKAVVDYLVKKGISRKRLKSAGYGFDRPVADNNTPIGRAKNRRTEFKLLKDEEAKDGDAKIQGTDQTGNNRDIQIEKETPAKPAEKKSP